MFIDTHAHVNFNAFKDDGEAVLLRCLEAGMSVVNVGSQYSTSKRAVQYAHKFATLENLEAKPPRGGLAHNCPKHQFRSSSTGLFPFIKLQNTAASS
jgi:hypothetical protein